MSSSRSFRFCRLEKDEQLAASITFCARLKPWARSLGRIARFQRSGPRMAPRLGAQQPHAIFIAGEMCSTA
jgi:hypothetical protein